MRCYRKATYFFLVLAALFMYEAKCNQTLTLDMSSPSAGTLNHFWTSTGLCPPEPRNETAQFLLSQDELMNLAFIGAVPRAGIRQVRIHWLLDLITISENDSGDDPTFDFTDLDSIIEALHSRGLAPGFELMGNPGDYFTDFDDEAQVEVWRNLVRDIATRYLSRYDTEYVSSWRFELWNEPDLLNYNVVNFTISSYLKYARACREGLDAASNSSLRLGGPAGLFKDREKHPLCWGLLDYCEKNRDSCPVDFISFHKKGSSSGAAILQQDLELSEEIRNRFPNLADIPVANDESDPLTGWSASHDWRGDVRYAAMVTRVVADHQDVLVRRHNISLEVLSNDNGFLNYNPFFFTQRTLLARFQMNNTDPPHIQYIRKPVYTAMAMLSYLGRNQIDVTIAENDPRLSVIATEEPDTTVMLITFNNETQEDSENLLDIRLHVKNIPAHYLSDGVFHMYVLNQTRTNPYSEWKKRGSQVFPDFLLRELLRSNEGPFHIDDGTFSSNDSLRVDVSIGLPSVFLFLMCAKTDTLPGQVTQVTATNVTGGEVLITWSDELVNTKCILTYEVEFSETGADFRRVNPSAVLFLSYQYNVNSSQGTERGYYRVRALDYWYRGGPYSTPVVYPPEYEVTRV